MCSSSEADTKSLGQEVERVIDGCAYGVGLTQEGVGEIHHLRMRMERELADEDETRFNLKKGRGGLVDSPALVDALKSGQLGHLGLDVYEEEADLFFEDRSQEILDDDVFARLLTFPNVLITAHQAFLTHEALAAIAETTLANGGHLF